VAVVVAADSSWPTWRSPRVQNLVLSPARRARPATVSRSKLFLSIESYCGLAFFTAPVFTTPWFAAIGTGCVVAGLFGVVLVPGAGCVVWSVLLGVVPPLPGVVPALLGTVPLVLVTAAPLFGVALALVGAVPPLVGVVLALLAAAAAWTAACANGD